MSATRDDADTVITAELPLKLETAVERLGYTLGAKVHPANEPDAAAAQEYYIANAVYKCAEARRDRAKSALLGMVTVPATPGKHIAHDSAIAVVTIDNRAQPRRLSEPHIINMICREFKCDVDRAKQLVDSCKQASPGFQQHINAVLK